MPKVKTHKGLQKRVRLTPTGKIMRRRAGGSHLMSGWPGKASRRLRKPLVVTDSEKQRIIRLMQNPKYYR